MKWTTNVDTAYLNWACHGRVSIELSEELQTNQTILNNISVDPITGYSILHHKVSDVRNSIADILNFKSEQIIFTTGAIHGLELVCRATFKTKDIKVFSSSHEFPTVYSVLHNFFENVTILPFPELMESISKLPASDERYLFIFSHICYNTGSILETNEIITAIRLRFPNAFIIIDGSQAVGNIKVNLSELYIDCYLFNTNKWLNGTYTGVLAVRNNDLYQSIQPLINSSFAIHDSSEIEKLSSSGLNLCYAASLVSIIPVMHKAIKSHDFGIHQQRLKQLFVDKIVNQIDIIFADKKSIATESGLLSFSLPGLSYSQLHTFGLMAIEHGLFFHIFPPNSFNKQEGEYAILRFAIHWLNTDNEILKTIDFIKKITSDLHT